MRTSFISILVAALFVSSVSMLLVARKVNHIEGDLITAQTKADSLSNTTTSVDLDVKNLEDKSDSLSLKSKSLERLLTESKSRLAATNGEIMKARDTAELVKKKYEQLLAQHKDIETESETLKAENARLDEENKKFTAQVASLNSEVKSTNEHLFNTTLTSKDNILIMTLDANGKLNLNGKKIRKIVTSLHVQADMKKPAFKIYDHTGTELPQLNGTFNLARITESSSPFPSGNSLKIELTYELSKGIAPGLYRIEILNDNKHIGNFYVTLK